MYRTSSLSDAFDLVVFDMAGTTVRDVGEVSECFLHAAEANGIRTTPDRILAMMGWSKRQVFQILLTEQLGADHPELTARIDRAYADFRAVLERWYETNPVEPSEGCLGCFKRLRAEGVRIALTTGFYRKVTDIILRRLGWDAGLDERYMGADSNIIQLSLSSDQAPVGRPAPYLIHGAMMMLGVQDVRRVVKIGDTPVDLQAGRNAGCGLTLGVANGTHSWGQLSREQNDGILGCVGDLPDFLERAAR